MATTLHGASEPAHNGVIDVSELPTARVQQYVREVGDGYLERRAGRTFLVTREA